MFGKVKGALVGPGKKLINMFSCRPLGRERRSQMSRRTSAGTLPRFMACFSTKLIPWKAEESPEVLYWIRVPQLLTQFLRQILIFQLQVLQMATQSMPQIEQS